MSSLFRRMLAGLCAALIIGVPAFGDAGAATSPIRLADTVTIENAQVTANQVSPFTDSIRDLNRALNINIFVVIIDSPTGDMYNWTRTTATQNGLQSGKDVLLAIALESRDATIDSLGYLSGTQQNDILTRGLKPGLSSRPVDWERAGYDFYTVFEQVWMNNGSPQNYSSSARQESGGRKSGISFLPLLFVGVGGAAIIFFIVRRKRGKKKAEKEPSVGFHGKRNNPAPVNQQQLEALNQQSHYALIQTDRSYKQASTALDEAKAEFGQDSLAEFQQALQEVQAHLHQAFGLRQELDDAFPETAQQQFSMLSAILDHCNKATHIINKNGEKFSQLRNILSDPEPRLDALTQRTVAVRARILPAKEKLDELIARFGEEPIGYVAHNVEAADENISEAEQLIDHGRAILQGSMTERGNVVPAIVQAEDFMRQAEDLLDAIEHADQSITFAQLHQNRVKDELAGKVKEVEQYLASNQNSNQLDLSNITKSLQSAHASLAYYNDHAATDPARSYQMLVSAKTGLETALMASRSELSTKQRQQETLNQALMAAQAQVQAAYDAITTRANFVQSEARTRLSEAQSRLATAQRVAGTDRLQALQEAQAAVDMAQQALRAAQRDENKYLMMHGGGYGSRRDFASGILVGSVLNNNRQTRPSALHSISTAIWGLGQIASLFNGRRGGGGQINFRIGGGGNDGGRSIGPKHDDGPSGIKF